MNPKEFSICVLMTTNIRLFNAEANFCLALVLTWFPTIWTFKIELRYKRKSLTSA